MNVRWSARERPLPIEGAIATGEAAARFARRLLALDDDALARLRGVASPQLIALLGASADLPWTDGIVYLGRDEAAPQLYLPTTRATTLPPALIARAIVRREPALPPPFVLTDTFNAPRLIVSLAAAGPIDRRMLEAWRPAA